MTLLLSRAPRGVARPASLGGRSRPGAARRRLAKPLATALAAGLVLAGAARAADVPAPDAAASAPDGGDQVVVPQVERRDVHRPKYPSNDFEIGIFGGAYSSQDFGTHGSIGARLGYDITEDFFVEGDYAQTKVSDDTYRRILPGGVFPFVIQRLQYYDLSAGYNILPGEVFFGKNWARASALYVIGGVGATTFDKQRMQTFNYGFGAKVYLADWGALRVDMRNHVYSVDLLGKRDQTQNLEFTFGSSFFF